MGWPQHLRGHPIRLDGDVWRYVDNGNPTTSTHTLRSCGHCGRYRTKEGHDPCWGTLARVINACCGHGVEAEAYVQFMNGRRLGGREAVEWVRENPTGEGGRG